MYPSQRQLDHFQKAAIEAATEAGNLLLKNSQRVGKIRLKGKINLVTEMDLRSEDLIVSRLRKVFPDFSFLAEEHTSLDGKNEFRWIIDPLDGTTNYAHRFPFWCVSIALECQGEVIVGVVNDPVRDELFTATINTPSRLNGKRIKVSASRRLTDSLLATGFPYDIRTNSENNLDHFREFALTARAIRRAGSAALDLCYLACGRFDGYWELKLSPWDVAAGQLIVRQAGGKVTDFSGEPLSIYGKNVLATNGIIHGQMVWILKRRLPADDAL